MRLIAWLGVSLVTPTACAEKPDEIDLWPAGKIPGEAVPRENKEIVDKRIGRKTTLVAKPTLTVFRPEKPNGSAIIICPGGGYHILAWDLEGVEIAKWLNKLGITAFALKYRVPRRKDREMHDLPLRDSRRAVRLVRHLAKDFGIEPKRIGILGFSAGGHLAALTTTQSHDKPAEKIDNIDEQSSAVATALLIYPAYLTDKRGSMKVAAEFRIDRDTPPTFFITTHDDRVPATNCLAFYLAFLKAKVPVEVHVFPTGGHGYGLRKSKHGVSGWPKLAESWLRARRFVR